MTRTLTLLLAASGFAALTSSVQAVDWQIGHASTWQPTPPAQHARQWPAHFWPNVAHAPAITRTLDLNPNYNAPPPSSPAYDYEWQNQPSPPAPVLAPPTFSHPQQGYFPRENLAPQIVPGYEYDFGGAGTYPPLYPIEGASWKAPRAYTRATGFSTPEEIQVDAEGYAHCNL